MKRQYGKGPLANPAIALLSGVLAILMLGGCGGASKDAITGARSSAPSNSAGAKSAKTTSVEAAVPAGLPTISKAYTGYKGDEDDDDVHVPRTNDTSLDNDADFDNDVTGNRGKGYLDSDDEKIAGYGKPAKASERREVTALFERYYGAALADDGAAVCRSIYSIFREAIPEDYGSGAGSPYARGKTCAEVMTKIFKHAHSQLTPSLRVTLVRIQRNKGYVLLGSKIRPASYLNLQRERGSWKIIGLLPTPLP